MVKMVHLRKARMCSRGARAFFVRHNLDWDAFLREGVPAEALAETGDAMALEVVEVARGQQ
jgi:hypothetical protein